MVASHGFIHGSKRTAWVAGYLFLADNGLSIDFVPTGTIRVEEGVAARRVNESELADWIRSPLCGLIWCFTNAIPAYP